MRESIRGSLSEVATSFLSMAQGGRSWSGRERNCAFLNLGGESFANISSASGIDFPDDGRGAGLCDWDLDGDLDLWTCNRSAPMLRLMRNDNESGHNWIAIGLEGRDCNRDAIGARVEVHLKGEDVPLLRTLRAGDAFLSQSSKWLHFGLGANAKIEKLAVRWPGNSDLEEFSGATADARFHLVQGTGKAIPWSPAKTAGSNLEPGLLVPPPAGDSVQVVTTSAIPVPQLNYTSFTGETKTVKIGTIKKPAAPVLLNLWASWCLPCLTELTEWKAHASALNKSGVQIYALSVDALNDSEGPAKAMAMTAQLKLPFTIGLAPDSVPEKIQMLNDQMFEYRKPLPVPTTILINHYGQLEAIYKGAVSTERIIRDVTNMPTKPTEKRDIALPFRGRWLAPVRQQQFFPLALQLARAGYPEDAEAILRDHTGMLMSQTNAPRLLLALGQNAETRADWVKARAYYVKTVNTNQRFTQGVNAYARLLAACPDDAVRNPEDALAIAKKIATRTNNNDPLVLDTLAMAHAASGNFEAAANIAEKAVSLAKEQELPELAQQITQREAGYKNGIPYEFGE
jgi:peroxiredoxin